MTNEEAIGCLDLIKTDAVRINEAIDMAIEALEKNIPIEVYRTDAFPHRLYCSKCYKTIYYNEENLKVESNRYEYCPHCGQKLDWN